MYHTLRFRASEYAGNFRQPAHAHDHLQISMVLRGSLQETVHGAVATAGALSIVVKDAGVVHADRFGPDRVAIAQLSLPHGELRDLLDASVRTIAWRWSHSSDTARPFLRTVVRAASGVSQFANDDADVADLLASLTARPAQEVRGAPPVWLSDVVAQLRATWRPGTRVGVVAAQAGVHPVYLARCFRRWYGHGVSDELRDIRRRTAANAIATGVDRLSTIAHATGYADESHLNREFRALSGTTPGRFRRAVDHLLTHTVDHRLVSPIQV